MKELDEIAVQCPPELRSDFQKLIKCYEKTIFEPQEFPRFPQDRGPEHEFKIQLESGTWIVLLPLHCLSPAFFLGGGGLPPPLHKHWRELCGPGVGPPPGLGSL